MPVARTTAAPDLPSIRPGASIASRSVRPRARECGGERPQTGGTRGHREERHDFRGARLAAILREDRSQNEKSSEGVLDFCDARRVFLLLPPN